MKTYLKSLFEGLFVGVLNSPLRACSPALPLVALVGLFGIQAGKPLVPVARQILGDATTAVAAPAPTVVQVSGQSPGRNTTSREETRSND